MIEVEYKWGEKKFHPRHDKKRDAGLLFYCTGDVKNLGKQVWPNSIECQIQEGDTCDLWVIRSIASSTIDAQGSYLSTGESKTIGEEKDFESVRHGPSVEKEGWNKVKVVLKGDTGQFFLNEQLLNEFKGAKDKDGKPLTEGFIALQAEGAEVTYRNFQIYTE